MNDNKSRVTLVFAPHPDDEVLGVGGTIIKKARNGEKVIVCIATKGYIYSTRKKESELANQFMGVEETVFLDFTDLELDRVPHTDLTDAIREVIKKYEPDEVYVPHPGDLHTDHKALTAAVLVAIRPKYKYSPELVFTYETLSETGLDYQNPQNYFEPNVFVDISETIDDKIKALEMHESQIEEYPNSRSSQSLKALSVYRGTQAGMKGAEAFAIVRGYFR